MINVDPETVRISEEDDSSTTGGHYGTETVRFTASGNSVTNFDVTLPIAISLLTTAIDTKKVNDGDQIGFDVAPETTVGALAEEVTALDTSIAVPQSVIDLFEAGTLWIGQHLLLGDEDCGIVISWDDNNNLVNVKTGPATTRPIGTLIKITTSMSPGIFGDGWVELEQGTDKVYEFGHDKIGGSFIPAGKVVRIRYKNNSNPDADAVVKLAYLY